MDPLAGVELRTLACAAVAVAGSDFDTDSLPFPCVVDLDIESTCRAVVGMAFQSTDLHGSAEEERVVNHPVRALAEILWSQLFEAEGRQQRHAYFHSDLEAYKGAYLEAYLGAYLEAYLEAYLGAYLETYQEAYPEALNSSHARDAEDTEEAYRTGSCRVLVP